MERLRLALVDDHHLVRESLCGLLNRWPEGEVVWDAGGADEYEALAAERGAPDIALVDLNMPIRDGWALLRWITEHEARTKCIAFSVDPSEEAGWRALQCGARAVLGKGDRSADWYSALVAVRDEGDHLNNHTRAALRFRPEKDSPVALRERLAGSLTHRELRFLTAYISDAEPTLKDLACEWGVEESTVETWRKRVAEKLGACSRLAMYKCALRFHLV